MMITWRTGRAEDTDCGAQLCEGPEPVDEFGLDAKYPPRIGVHPPGGTATLQQPLIVRCVSCGPLAADDSALHSPVFGFLHQATFCPFVPISPTNAAGRCGRR